MEKAELVALLTPHLPLEDETGTSTCSICYEEHIVAVHMPCCSVEGSSLAYCRSASTLGG